ncbi:MAG: T9SS type A sorting domain-containing protein [Ferruginibacter sp.]
MKKSYYFYPILILLTISSKGLQAQTNLVPNYSFETFSSCPNGEDQVQKATGWSKYSQNISTPDYYNACAPSTGFGVPKNALCFQQAYGNGNAYMGVVTYASTIVNYREHIGIQLTQPLIIGQKYFISFNTVMAELNFNGSLVGMPSNNIGIRLSNIPYTPTSPAPIDNFVHLRSIDVINDSINWIHISGSIIANSAYQYLSIGNFFNDQNTDTIHYSCGSCTNAASYYLVDDICVSTDSATCNVGILPVLLRDFNVSVVDKKIKLYWHTEEEINITAYKIQRSTTPNHNFTDIAAIPANKNTNNDYSFIDVAVLHNLNYYYRIAILENGLINRYSEIKKAGIIGDKLEVSIIKNPTSGLIDLYLNNLKKAAQIKVINTLGQIVKQQIVNVNDRQLRLNILNHPKGNYWLIIESNKEKIIRRIIKL